MSGASDIDASSAGIGLLRRHPASNPYGTLYIGATNNIASRVDAHRKGSGSKFTSRYKKTMLVHFVMFDDIREAIQREKTLKHCVRAWKDNRIESGNPRWIDVYPALSALLGNSVD